MSIPTLVHGTRPLRRTVMEVGRGWALMSDGDDFLVWRIGADAQRRLTVASVVEDHGAGRFVTPGGAVAYREADEEGDMRRATRASWALAA